MKRTKSLVVTFLTALLLCVAFVLTGCSDNAIAGTYKFYSMTMGETEIKAGEEYEGMTFSEDYMVLTLEDDGTLKVEMKMTYGGEEQSKTQTGTWKEVDGKVELTIDEETQTATHDGDTLTIEEDGMKMVFKK